MMPPITESLHSAADSTRPSPSAVACRSEFLIPPSAEVACVSLVHPTISISSSGSAHGMPAQPPRRQMGAEHGGGGAGRVDRCVAGSPLCCAAEEEEEMRRDAV